MPEIIIQPDGSMLIPRGSHVENQFFLDLTKDIVDEETFESLLCFFDVSEQSENISGISGLCG